MNNSTNNSTNSTGAIAWVIGQILLIIARDVVARMHTEGSVHPWLCTFTAVAWIGTNVVCIIETHRERLQTHRAISVVDSWVSMAYVAVVEQMMALIATSLAMPRVLFLACWASDWFTSLLVAQLLDMSSTERGVAWEFLLIASTLELGIFVLLDRGNRQQYASKCEAVHRSAPC